MDITRIDPKAALYECRAHHRTSKGHLQQYVSWMPGQAARVLDVGSGPGTLAVLLAERASFVVGVDASPSMMGLARKSQTECGKTNVAWVIASADALPFRAATFDYITSTFALRFSNPHWSLPEIRRTIAPGGRVAIRDVVSQVPRFGFWPDHCSMVMRLAPKLLRRYGWRGMFRMVAYQLGREGVHNARKTPRFDTRSFMEIYERYFPEKERRFIFSPGKLFWQNGPERQDSRHDMNGKTPNN